MKKKGFTLIELLAVIVILAIIALIAIPLIGNVIEKSKIGAAKSSVLGYVDAVEKQIMINSLDASKPNIVDGEYTIGTNGELGGYIISLKGKAPTGTIKIENGKIIDYKLTVNGYTINYDGELTSSVASYKLSGILKDENYNPLANTVLTLFPSSKVVETNEIGEFNIDNLEQGSYELYIMTGKTVEEVIEMTKEDILSETLGNVSFNTDDKELVFNIGNYKLEIHILSPDTPKYEIIYDYGYNSIKLSSYIASGLKYNLPIPEKRSNYEFLGWYDESDNQITKENIVNNNIILTAKWNYICNYNVGETWDFNYTGGEQEFNIPCDGTYKLETWGAQGGTYYVTRTNYGAYSVGNIDLAAKETIFINVGGKGKSTLGSGVNNPWNGAVSVTQIATGGYNGGGDAGITSSDQFANSGGGATHIALKSGVLSKLKDNVNEILIVSGGGGANGGWQTGTYYDKSSAAGGISSSDVGCYVPAGLQNSFSYRGSATQESGAQFGLGISATHAGGGGGFFGGSYGGPSSCSSAGGSSYIGNEKLTDKAMYCYNCTTSDVSSTKTISTTCSSTNPTANCSKLNDGYAKITLVSID